MTTDVDELSSKEIVKETDERLLERWINVCREKVSVLRYLSVSCRLNGHLLTLIGQAESLELEVSEAVATANALMASKSRLSIASFCDPTVTLSPLHVAVDRLLLDHALLRAQFSTKRTACYQFANALEIFNKQYTELICGGDLSRMLAMLADFYANHAPDSVPVVYDLVMSQKADMDQIVKCFEEFRDDVKHLLKAGRCLKLIAPQNSANDLKRIELKIADLKSRLREIGDWVESHQKRLSSAEHEAKHFDTSWRNLLSWIDETLMELSDLQDEYSNKGNNNGSSLKALKSTQRRIKSEKVTRLVKCVQLADKLSSMATPQDKKLLKWQTSSLKERFELLETAVDNCEAEFVRTLKEDLRLNSVINECKKVICDGKTYLTKANTASNQISLTEEAKLVGALILKTRQLLDGQDGIDLLKKQIGDNEFDNYDGNKNDNRAQLLADKFERQLVEISNALGKREVELKHDADVLKSFSDAYQFCRTLLLETNTFISVCISYFGDDVIGQLDQRLECIENAFAAIPSSGTDLRISVTGETADLYNEIEGLKQAIEIHSKRREQVKNMLSSIRRQMEIIRKRFIEIVRSVPMSRPLCTANSNLRSQLLNEIALTKQRLQLLIRSSPPVKEAKKAAKHRRTILLLTGNKNKMKNQNEQPLAKYLEIHESAEARQLYLECTRLANKLSS